MRILGWLVSMAFLCASAGAQDYAGTFTGQAASGMITLTLQQDAYGDYIGRYVNDSGISYEVEGEVDEEALSGFIANEEEEFAFGAALNGEQLVVYLIPFDASGEPRYDAADEIVLARQQGSISVQSGVSMRQDPAATPSNPTRSPLGAMMNPQRSAGLAGTYSGMLNGTPTTLTLQQQGSSFQGEADAGGYRYTLSGTVQGNTATGQLSDPQTGGAMNVELALQGDQLSLVLLAQDGFGQTNRIPAQFQRGAAASQGLGSQGMGAGTGSPAQENVERDPALVGGWSYTESMTSGDASMVTQMFLQVNPDGTYATGNGRAVGGGAGWSGDTGYGGDVARGQWRTQNGVVYVKENGVGQWAPYARYYVEGGRMMFTFGDGSRQVWHRR